MDNNIIQEIFDETSYYCSNHSVNELRYIYERHAHSYISAPDFIEGLKDLGYTQNKNGKYKLRIKKTIRKQIYGY